MINSHTGEISIIEKGKEDVYKEVYSMCIDKMKKWSKSFWGAILTIFVIIVIIGLIIAVEVRKKPHDLVTLYNNITISILCSIVASIIYAIMCRVFSNDDDKRLIQQLHKIEKRLQRQDELYDSGIISIHPKTHFDDEEDYWNNIINGTNKRLDLIGHSISNWFKQEYKFTFKAKIKQILESNNNVNIILSATEVNWQCIKEVLEGTQKEYVLSKLEKTLLYLCQILEEIPQDKHKNLKVYISDFRKVTYLYIRTDERCIISPYIFSNDSNNNSFLLELKPRTSYVKSLEDDFEEMIDSLEQIDLSLNRYDINENKLVELDHKKTTNKYAGSNWNFEETEKFIYGDRYRKFEVGYFEHYNDRNFVKSVIELPVSYGCPSKCLFCASSNIENFEILKAEQMFYIFQNIYESKQLCKKTRVLLSLTGMGDLYFNADNVFKFLQFLEKYENLSITLSSSFWDTKLLERVINLKESLSIRYIQLTYISNLEGAIAKIVPFRSKRKILPGVTDFIDYVAESKEKLFRINYIVIQNVNDSNEDIDRFIQTITKIKDKIVIRISKLNETNATRRNSLNSVSIDRLNSIKDILIAHGFECYVFYAFENDNMNCGQLLTELL